MLHSRIVDNFSQIVFEHIEFYFPRIVRHTSVFLIFLGYNSTLGKNGDHLNAYLLAKIIKAELQIATDDALAAQLGKNNRKAPSKIRNMVKTKRKKAMTDLRDHNVDLQTYMSHMGSLSEKHDKRSKEEGTLLCFIFEKCLIKL